MPPPPSWIILGAVPRVSAQQDADISLDLAAPPRVSVLTVPPRVSPIQAGPAGAYPWVVTADPASGLLLLCTPLPALPPTPPSPAAFRNGVRVLNITDIVRRPPTYFVCDVASATAFPLPPPGRDPTGLGSEINALNLGVVAAPRESEGGALRYMAVEFRYMFADQNATLLCFSSDTGEWAWKRVHNPLGRWLWGTDGVIAHDGKLWWVDLAGGLLFCDPFADAPVLDMVPFPEGDCHQSGASCTHCAGRSMAGRRFAQVSAGKFRCVEWSSRRGNDAPMTVTMWTLNDPESKEWVLEYKVSFQEIWADESYKAAGLSEKNPTFALIHPMDPDVLYFFLEEHLFSVDLRANKVVECGAYDMVLPPSGEFPNCFSVRALELPVALSPGLLPSDVGNGSKGEEVAPPALASSSLSLEALSLENEFE